MSSAELTNIIIGVAVVALLLVRQMQPRQTKETSGLRLTLILGVIGLIDVNDAVKGHTVGSETVAWVIVSLVVGGAFGALRAATITLWTASDGTVWRRGTLTTAILWVASLGLHLGLEAAIDGTTTIAGLGAASILLYLAVTLGVQREVLRWRAARLTPGTASRGPGWGSGRSNADTRSSR